MEKRIKYKFVSQNSVVPIDYNTELVNIKQQYTNTLITSGLTDDVIFDIRKKKRLSKKEEEILKKRLKIEDEFSKILDSLSEYKEMKIEKFPTNLDRFDAVFPIYFDGKEIINKWRIEKNNKDLIKSRIDFLKKTLSIFDFKIIKYYESYLTGNFILTDKVKLFLMKRQKMRDEINSLQKILKH